MALTNMYSDLVPVVPSGLFYFAFIGVNGIR